ncbi:MAG: AMP-binding protein, partial [Kiritimatiellae bacterium]|nr:AMP-binding protein [Kiritimatiellia bacterium]
WERLVWLIRPLRFASLLPLSHMFGQMLGVFVSLVMGATTIFTSPLGSPALARLLREERILVLFAVPRALSGLADHLRREMGRRKRLDSFERRFSTTAERHAWRRIWEFRDVHRMLGWRFWAMVVGGASTDRDVIEFWRRLGYAVIQGYGLTEAGPIVTVNNPFGPSVYSVGRAVGEQQIRIAADGEILVKGPNITPGYFQSPELTRDAFEDGWFRTGDIGEIDQHGYLHIKGRKKDVIVTDEGMNVFPEDIERVLDRHPLVKASVVVPMRQHNRTVLHAVLILRTTDADPRAILAEVNAGLEPHQKLASASIWPGLDFPRTPTQKIKRAEIQQRLNVQPFETGEMGAGRLEAIVSAIAEGGGAVPSEARLENDLGLSSLDRVEMACLLEDRFQISVSETLLRGDLTVGELKRLVEEVPESETRLPFPSWPRWWPVRMARCAALLILGFPILRLMCRIKTRNAADLCNVNPPVIFVSNHTSHLDTPAILRALPHRLRMRIAPAMTTRYFGAYLERKGYPLWQQVSVSLAVYLLYLLGNVYFLPPTAGFRSALRHTGRLVNRGFCPLVYPEGRISLTGRVEKFKPGIGLMVREMRVPVIPVFVDGLADILPPHARWPRKHGTGFVTFGSAITFGPEKPEEIAERLELEVRRLANLSA